MSEALTIAQVVSEAALGRSTVFEAIKRGDLVARKYGHRTIVLRDDLRRFLHNLPTSKSAA